MKYTVVERQQARERNRAFVTELNARTFCAHCGAQPIEWHNPEHVELNRRHFQIGALVRSTRSIAAIEAEISRCTPLCRRCHMTEDGRMNVFMRHALAPKGQPPKPCIDCEKPAKPLRKGRCVGCDRRWRYAQNPDLLERKREADRLRRRERKSQAVAS